ESSINFRIEEGKAIVRAGRSQFTLATLPAADSPNVEDGEGSLRFAVSQNKLRRFIDRNGGPIAQQEVRHYLNGMLLKINAGQLRAVATDGHRMAMCTVDANIDYQEKYQLIVPRKGILELARLLAEADDLINVVLGSHHIRATT